MFGATKGNVLIICTIVALTVISGKPNSSQDEYNWLPMAGRQITVQSFFATLKENILSIVQRQFSFAASKRKEVFINF